jgi:hypothetical protein
MSVTLNASSITFNDNSVQTLVFDVYTGSTGSNTTYPIGTTVATGAGSGSYNVLSTTLNSTKALSVASTAYFFLLSGGSALAGTWKFRGTTGAGNLCDQNMYGGLWQRVA